MYLPQGTFLQNGKYKIVRFIASGGFGCTYEGMQTLMGERVAIKELFINDFCNREDDNSVTVGSKSKIDDFRKLKRSFIKEATVLFRMQNPHIVRVTDVFEENGTAYYVMDYIDGHSLTDIIKQKGKLSEAEAVGYILQVCEALKYVHSQNRMHMDIKPGNIMLDKKGKALLIDFGASKYYDEETGEQTSSNLGTYTKGYAPFEQVSRTVKTFNPPTDIYALGATLYKLLTGVTPPSSMALMSEAETLQPLPLTISEPTRKAVESAMQLKDKYRPQTIEEFERILSNKNGNSASFEPQNPSIKVKEPVLNNGARQLSKTKIIIGACSAIAIFLIYFFAFSGNSESKITKEEVLESEISPIEQIEQEDVANNTIVKDAIDPYNGHEYVDLGLPSGLKWATCNIGASQPEEYGDYFAWGETKTKSSYDENNSETYGRDNKWLSSKGYIGDNGNLTLSHDAARQKWGGSWRMPTKEEVEELIENTTTEWATQNGVNGKLVKSKKNDNSIFLPTSGYRYDSIPKRTGEHGYFWSSTPNESNSEAACYLWFNSNYFGSDLNYRYRGRSIRPVSE